MASLWKNTIRQASYRGAPFGVTDAESEGGRRTVLHEFPQRDMPYAEDMGMASARFTLQAFVLGPDYMAARDRLRGALEKPGPGTLVHPWLGELTVCQFAPYKLRETAQDGGMAVFTLSFVRSEAAKSPAASVNQARKASLLASIVGGKACVAFDRAISLVSQGAWVVRQTWAAVQSTIRTVQAVMRGDVRTIAGLLGAATGYDFLALAGMGLSVWGALQSMGDLFPSGCEDEETADWCRSALTVAAMTDPAGAYRYSGQASRTIAANAQATRDLVTRLCAVQAVTTALTAVPESRQAAANLRDNIVDAVDAALAIDDDADARLADTDPASLPGFTGEYAWRRAMDDTLDDQLRDLRSAALAAIARQALSAPQVGRVENLITRPWLPIAWQASAGIGAEADLVARNAVRHPLFVPAGSVEVLRG